MRLSEIEQLCNEARLRVPKSPRDANEQRNIISPRILCQLPSHRALGVAALYEVSICPLDVFTRNLIVPLTISNTTWSFLPWIESRSPEDDLGLISIWISICLPTVYLSSVKIIHSLIFQNSRRFKIYVRTVGIYLLGTSCYRCLDRRTFQALLSLSMG